MSTELTPFQQALVKTFKVFLWTLTSAALMALVSWLESGELQAQYLAWAPLVNAIAYPLLQVANMQLDKKLLDNK
jgi:hypothetical protein